MMGIGKALSALGHFAAAKAKPRRCFRALNLTRATELAGNLELAGDSASRTKGLLGRDSLAAGEGLWIVPCEGVHTIGMRFAIDLVYIDRKHRVRKVRSAVPSWRLSLCVTAHSVLELPAGVVETTQTRRGDQLQITPL